MCLLLLPAGKFYNHSARVLHLPAANADVVEQDEEDKQMMTPAAAARWAAASGDDCHEQRVQVILGHWCQAGMCR